MRNTVTRSMGAIAMTRIHMEFRDYPPESKIKILALRCDNATWETYVDSSEQVPPRPNFSRRKR